MTGYDADPICDIPNTCHILPYHIRKRKKQYDCQCDCDEIFVRNFKSSLQHLRQHYIEVDVTVSECSNWPTNLYIEQPDGSHGPDWYNRFLGMDFSFLLPRRANVFCIQLRSHEKMQTLLYPRKTASIQCKSSSVCKTAFCETCQG